MPFVGKTLGMLLRKLAHDRLERSVGGGQCNAGPELDPRCVGPEGNVETRDETGRQVNIADAEAVIECEGARHDPNDGVGGVIDFEYSPDNVRISAEVALP